MGFMGPEASVQSGEAVSSGDTEMFKVVSSRRISLTIVGGGPEEEALKALAVELETDVAFPGFADQRELPRV